MSLPPIGKMGQINSSKVQGKLIPKQVWILNNERIIVD